MGHRDGTTRQGGDLRALSLSHAAGRPSHAEAGAVYIRQGTDPAQSRPFCRNHLGKVRVRAARLHPVPGGHTLMPAGLRNPAKRHEVSPRTTQPGKGRPSFFPVAVSIILRLAERSIQTTDSNIQSAEISADWQAVAGGVDAPGRGSPVPLRRIEMRQYHDAMRTATGKRSAKPKR